MISFDFDTTSGLPVLDLATLDTMNLSIEAIVSGVDQVVFEATSDSDTYTKTEIYTPYSLAGNGLNAQTYAPASLLRKGTSSLHIKATPYNGEVDGNGNPVGIPGVSYETTIKIVHSGKLTFGGSLLSRDLNPFQINTSPEVYYYGNSDGTGTKASTPDALEVGNVDKVAVTLVENTDGVYIIFIYDEPGNAASGGFASVIVLKDGVDTFPAVDSPMEFSDNVGEASAASLAGGSLSHSWGPGDNDGFGIGPFTAYTTVCFEFWQGNFFTEGARYIDYDVIAANGSVRPLTLASSASELLNKQFCITTPESH